MDDLSTAIEKKKVDAAAIKQLASTYSATPQFGNAMASLDVYQLLDAENAMDLIQCIQARLAAQIRLLENSNTVPIKPTDASISTGGGSIVSGSHLSKRVYVVVYRYDAKEEGELNISEEEQLESDHVESGSLKEVWTKMFTRSTISKKSSPLHLQPLPSLLLQSQASLDPLPWSKLYIITLRPVTERSRFSDTITVTNKDTGSDSWWEGTGSTGLKGQFPINYVKSPYPHQQEKQLSLPPRPVASKTTFTVKALYDYDAADSGELSFRKGDEIEISESSDVDWWTGRLLPASYVAKV
ncbi:UNVERIFIED_CONTAM: hypothetical protein HDU68_001803 [Siphonaria sp. JEL0065]|nr:hypothetical protein HDU68_001803 [Siphonaria sp. JEL0065]